MNETQQTAINVIEEKRMKADIFKEIMVEKFVRAMKIVQFPSNQIKKNPNLYTFQGNSQYQ